MAVFLAMMVMPFSRSRSIESMIRSGTDSFWRKSPDCHNMASTRVVLPWSTWAMIAMLRMLSRRSISPSYHAGSRALAGPPATIYIMWPDRASREDPDDPTRGAVSRRRPRRGGAVRLRAAEERPPRHHARQGWRDRHRAVA